mmetsp:Transcript_22901/g.59641  ORF Transcript_22901/g.59641 Transcript_22901/m.59641 type:complete len:140 (-) Transcript_22901:17-436(-)
MRPISLSLGFAAVPQVDSGLSSKDLLVLVLMVAWNVRSVSTAAAEELALLLSEEEEDARGRRPCAVARRASSTATATSRPMLRPAILAELMSPLCMDVKWSSMRTRAAAGGRSERGRRRRRHKPLCWCSPPVGRDVETW